MPRKRPSTGLQWAKKGQKCDVSRKICPSLFFAAARTAGKGPGVLKRFLIPPPPRPYTALAACGRCSWCGWQAKARLGVSRRKQRGQGFTSPLIFLHPLTFAAARTAGKGLSVNVKHEFLPPSLSCRGSDRVGVMCSPRSLPRCPSLIRSAISPAKSLFLVEFFAPPPSWVCVCLYALACSSSCMFLFTTAFARFRIAVFPDSVKGFQALCRCSASFC